MNEQQYLRLLRSCQPRPRSPLFASPALASLLRRLAKAARAREQAERVWREVAPDELATLGQPAGFADGEFIVQAVGPVQAEQLRRQAGRLGPLLSRALGRTLRLRIEDGATQPGEGR